VLRLASHEISLATICPVWAVHADVTVLVALGGSDVTSEARATFGDFVAARGQALQRTAFLLTGDWSLAEDLSPGEHGDNMIVVLTDPRARTFDWHVTGADEQVRHATAALSSGIAAVDVGQIRDRVRIDAVRDRDGKVLASNIAVGIPGVASTYRVQLAPVPDFADAPAASQVLADAGGQGNLLDEGAWDPPVPRHGTTVYARCYGGTHIVIGIDADAPGHRVVIPCDDKEHVVSGPPLLAKTELTSDETTPKTHVVDISASDDTAWRVTVVPR
jgi:hypothetical protein